MQKAARQRPGVAPDPDVLRLRAVHRAAAELRRGTPVLLTGECRSMLLAAETAGPRGLAELATLAARAARPAARADARRGGAASAGRAGIAR